MALGQRRASGVIHHSDQGSQCASLAFGKRREHAGDITGRQTKSREVSNLFGIFARDSYIAWLRANSSAFAVAESQVKTYVRFGVGTTLKFNLCTC